jgi:DNA-binding transcriptional regulator YiaG
MEREMENELPRIEAVTVEAPATLRLRWRGKKSASTVNLVGWIATGGDILASLKDPAVFGKAHVAAYGGAVAWDADGDLAIDAVHLKMLADEQKPFSSRDVQAWQDEVEVSNSEAADFLGISVSTWNSYKANAKVPQSIAMTLRCALRDPLLMQAHLRPRIAGRPRKAS